jgi:carbon monoxide dehydrogenase subunit G
MNGNDDPVDLSIAGEHIVHLSRQKLWESLNDPEVLQRCVKGCNRVEQVKEDEFCAVFNIRVGPVHKEFSARLNVVETSPPGEYQLVASMDAGVAGKLKGVADVQLEALGSQETRLRYWATVDVEGWIGGLGVKLLGNTAERYMQRFFDRMIATIDEQ